MKNKKNEIKLIVTACTMLGLTLVIIGHFDIIYNYITKIIKLSNPFILGLIIAYLLTPITNKLMNKMSNGKLKNKSYNKINTLSIIIVETVFITVVTIIITVIIVGVAGSGYNIIMKLPSAYEQFKDMLDELINKHDMIKGLIGHTSTEVIDNLVTRASSIIEDNFESIATNVFENTKDITKHIINFVFAIIISIFALANRAQFKRQSTKILKALVSERVYNKIIEVAMVADKKFSGFFIGKIVDSAIVGIICIICMSLLKMPYTMLISIIVFITNIVPIIGPIIGAVPGIIIIFSESPIQAIYFAIFIIILQQIDGHIIGPKCIGSATGLNTFYVLFALIISGGLWGIAGMIFGVPLFSVIYYIIGDFVNYITHRKELKNNENG